MFSHHSVILVIHSTIVAALSAAAAAADGKAASGSGAGAPTAEVTGVYALPDTPLASTETFIKNDRKILLGSVGSDLWHDPKTPPNRFWMITDRGPNGKVNMEGDKRRTFPVPEFTPMILHVEIQGKEIRTLQKIPIVDSHGVPVTGLSNIKGHDEKPYDYDGQRQLPYNPNGLDTEGLVRTAQGDFWLAEEYAPSLVHCDAGGKVLKRYVPAGLKLEGTGYPIATRLPGILALRKKNRGFEGLTLSRDEKTLYAIVQSPLLNPNKRVGPMSRTIRLLAFDIAGERPAAEYVYRLELSSTTIVSGLAMLSDATMLVLERTSSKAWLYKVDLAKATNILGSKWDDTSTSPSLEAVTDPASAGVTVLPKVLAVDLSKLSGIPEKVEGVVVLDARTIAVANDNDFDVGQFDAAGNNRGAGVKSQIVVIRLASPLFGQR
jgi:hypothetical protein